ncbi:hypothetical protein [Thiorhodovibrio frisius]|uniref:Uncharacterized protein n=1 Tax=Thiorhodovibrio frisius TaxID=631362 RepID=H8Z1W6_9GAMM|nr:hypothetical protein [Thiorhodovibrio frisius]EIC22594.1 hypothetical protein Thi970DRAFT_02867 [Thiorhodovibrio frisius]WPL20035.1 hypothetical protein Thiofri_00086 [Thiorhodovibrio frisius]
MTELEQLIQSHQQRAFPPPDGAARREQWLGELTQLLSELQEQLIAAGVPQDNIRLLEVPLNEDVLGFYEAPGLCVRIGTSEVVFQPKGARIIGALGRLCVIGPRGRAKLIADVDDNGEKDAPPLHHTQAWRWFVYPEQERGGQFLLTKDSLAHLLKLVLG